MRQKSLQMLCRENQIDHNSIVGIDFTAVRNIGGNQTEIGFFQKDQLRTNMDRSASIQKIFNLIEIVDNKDAAEGEQFEVLEDKTGFMKGDTPTVLQMALDQDIWVPIEKAA